MTYKYLVLSDTNNVIDYLFSSPRYRMIRGASMILDSLNRTETQRLIENFQGKLLSASGGEVKVLFSDEEGALSFKEAIKKLYLHKTDEVTLSSVVVERRENETMSAWFSRAERDLRLHEISGGKMQFDHLPVSPIMKRCEGCFKKPAEHEVSYMKEKVLYCRSCMLKTNQVFKTKEILETLSDQSGASISGLTDVHERLLKYAESKSARSKRTWVGKVSQLLENNESDNYIGFVYADGKNIGSLFRQSIYENEQILSGTDEDFIRKYQEISHHIHESLITAAVDTAIEFESKNVSVDYAMVGGDDFVAIMSGAYALPYTNRLIQNFEKNTAELTGYGKQQMGAGVVIAKSSYPIHRLFNLSYELMSRTKKTNDQSSLDFVVITDSTVQSVYEMRKNENADKQMRVLVNRMNRTEGFTTDESDLSLSKLYEVITLLKKNKFPRSKIKEIYDLVREQDEKMIEYRWLRWRARLSREVKEIFDKWNPDFRQTPYAFTKSAGGKSVGITPLIDLFDLYDFVKEEDDHE